MLECCGSSAELSFGSLLQNCSSRSRRVSRLAGPWQIMACGSRAEPKFASMFQNRSSRSRRVSELAGCLQFLACAPTVQGPRCASASEQNCIISLHLCVFRPFGFDLEVLIRVCFFWSVGAKIHTGIKNNCFLAGLLYASLCSVSSAGGPQDHNAQPRIDTRLERELQF